MKNNSKNILVRDINFEKYTETSWKRNFSNDSYMILKLSTLNSWIAEYHSRDFDVRGLISPDKESALSSLLHNMNMSAHALEGICFMLNQPRNLINS